MLLAVTVACVVASGPHLAVAGEASAFMSQDAIMTTLGNYLVASDQKTDLLRSRLLDLQRLHTASLAIRHLSNPITAFGLVKRLHSVWPRVGAELHDPADALLVDILGRRDALVDAVGDTLIRLQATYRLDSASLARGELQGVQCSEELDADDCFDLGRRSFLAGNFPGATEWMGEALTRHDEHTAQNVTEMLGFIANSQYKQGRATEAVRLTREILALEPDHQAAQRNLRTFRETPDNAQAHGTELPQHREAYKSLCRGEMKLDETTRAALRCRYADKGSWFLRLARLKEEDAFLSPRILIYHDVISPKEIEMITATARPRLKDAAVLNRRGSRKTTVDSARKAKNCWFQDKELPVVEALNRRAGQMTGLDISSGELLQAGQYGVGGHYEPHFDHVMEEHLEKAFGALKSGNRIATVLFYLNDVALGGATVFPQLKVTLFPAKGAAVVWFNLHQDGGGDARTRHAGCPVLAGNKWVLNKWLHERGQEFLRPCGLEQDSRKAR